MDPFEKAHGIAAASALYADVCLAGAPAKGGGQLEEARLVDRIGRFTAVPNSFLEASRTMSQAAFRLFIMLRFHTGNQSDEAFPGYKTLQGECNMARPTLAKAIKELIEAGWVTQRKRFSGKTTYTLHYPSSSKIEQMNSRSSEIELLDAPLVQKMNTISSEIEPQKFKKRTLTRLIELDSSNKTTDISPSSIPIDGTSDAQPAPKARQSKSKPKVSENFRPIYGWLQKLTLLNTPTRIGKVAKQIDSQGVSLEECDKVERYWFAMDWRGKKNQRPTPEQIYELWPRAMNWDGLIPPPSGNNHLTPVQESNRRIVT